MPSGHVTHAEKDGILVLRYFGRVDYMSAPAIKTFTDHLLGEHSVHGVVFDLCEADNLDSTNLGLLARVAERLRSDGGTRSVIVSNKDDINCVLASMGFDQICDIVGSEEEPELASGDEIEPAAPAEAELRNVMLDAHRTLVNLSEAGRVQFQDVVKCLESS